MFTTLFIALSAIPFIAAQATSGPLEVAAIEAHFKNAGLVPSLLADFTPSALLTLNFDGVGDVKPGQALTQAQVQPAPRILVTPANSTVKLGNNFTLTMVDADIVGTDESKGQTRHWLVNDVTLSGAPPNATVNASATIITDYAGPGPAAGSGAHRYVVLLYTQPTTFSPPDALSAPGAGVGVFNLNTYVTSSGLGSLVAATYITVENGQATVSVSATSPVVTSTLSVKATGSATNSAPVSTGSSTTTTSGAYASKALNVALSAVLSGLATFVVL